MKRNGMGINIILFVLIPLIAAISGCNGRSEESAQYYIFYVDNTMTKLVPVAYEPVSGSAGDKINDMLQKLSEDTESVEYKKPMPQEVGLISYSIDDRQLHLNFDSNYDNMDNIAEVLLRAAFVRTLIQLESIDGVSFYVGDSPLMDENGKAIGVMTADSFIENPGEQINSIQAATITLYFSNQQGNGLVKEVHEDVHYNSNTSMEKLVMEQLLLGPAGEDGIPTIPGGTKLVGVSLLDGVCFVNLDEGFLNQNYEIGEGIVIYSIVNSLVELPNVNKVQIAVNGDTSINYREKFSLNTVYERDLDYLETDVTKENVQKQEE